MNTQTKIHVVRNANERFAHTANSLDIKKMNAGKRKWMKIK